MSDQPSVAHSNKSRAFIEQQNLIRGAFGQRNSQRFVEQRQDAPITTFRTNLRQALLAARASLPESEFDPFLDWYHQQLTKLDHDKVQTHIGFDYLNGIITAPRTTLAREIKWIIARIKREADRIGKFRSLVDKVENAFLLSDAEGSLEALASIVESFGESMWSVQLRLGIEQVFHGLEGQKRYHDHVRSQFKRGILSYVSYNTSVRNEGRTTFARFKEMVGARIAARYEPELQHYLRYRLFKQWPETDQAITNILRAEQSHSIFDIYETFISLSQDIVRRHEIEHIAPLVAEGLSQIEISDYRLDKIRSHLDDRFSPERILLRPPHNANDLVTGDLQRVIWRTARDNAKRPEPWNIIYQAAAVAHGPKSRQHGKGVLGRCVRLLASVLNRSHTSASDIAELQKFCGNFSGLPKIAAIGDFLEQAEIELPNRALNLSVVGLNCTHWGFEDSGISKLLDNRIEQAYDQANHASREPYSQLACNPALPSDPSDCLVSFLRAVSLLREENVGQIPQLIEPIMERCNSLPLRNLAAILLIRSKMMLGDRVGTIRLIADEGARYPESIQFLPITDALSKLAYGDYKPLLGTLIPPIALDLLWRVTDDENVLSTLRFSTTQFLRRYGSLKPSQIIDQGVEFPRHQLIYFLRRVCVPNVLDVSRLFKNSREVLEERQTICGILNSLDAANSIDYKEEIFEITNSLKIVDGLRIVDSNRIHVDVDAISRWADRAISEDFARYKDLVRAGIGISDSIEDVLKEILLATKGGKQSFFTPHNESDAVLSEICERLRGEFLTNSSHGLDYFLSKRIRHQSFMGLIRGPLEFAKLITTRESEHSEYRSNEHWLDQLSTLDDVTRPLVDACFKRFAERFDEAAADLKDNVFHIKSAEKPRGLFEIELTGAFLVIARTVARLDHGLEDFLRNAYSLFWGALDSCLKSARRVIAEDLKTHIVQLIDNLETDVRQYAGADPNFRELNFALRHVSAEVQLALDEAESWFNRPELSQPSHTFTLEESLDVALESAQKLHRVFTPQLAKNVAGQCDIAGADLVTLTDVIFVAFDNINRHSGVESPRVSVSLSASTEKDVLNIEVISEVSERKRSTEQEAKLQELRELIEKRYDDKRVRREGGSGFLKLAALVQQSEKGCLNFGFAPDGKFHLSVRLPIILPLVSLQAQHTDENSSS